MLFVLAFINGKIYLFKVIDIAQTISTRRACVINGVKNERILCKNRQEVRTYGKPKPSTCAFAQLASDGEAFAASYAALNHCLQTHIHERRAKKKLGSLEDKVTNERNKIMYVTRTGSKCNYPKLV